MWFWLIWWSGVLFKNTAYVGSSVLYDVMRIWLSYGGDDTLPGSYHYRNIWFLSSKTSYCGDMWICHHAERTDGTKKIGLLSLWTSSWTVRLSFAIWKYNFNTEWNFQKKYRHFLYWMKAGGEGWGGRKTFSQSGRRVRLDSPPVHKNTQIFWQRRWWNKLADAKLRRCVSRVLFFAEGKPGSKAVDFWVKKLAMWLQDQNDSFSSKLTQPKSL